MDSRGAALFSSSKPSVTGKSQQEACAFVNTDLQKVEELKHWAPKLPRLEPLASALASRLGSDEFADVWLQTRDGGRFACHRIVLACGSPHLAEKMAALTGDVLDLPGKDGDIVEAVLQLLYVKATCTQILEADPRRTTRLLALASEWQLQDVYEECLRFVREDLKDIEALEYLAANTGFTKELVALQDVVHDRLRRLRETSAPSPMRRNVATEQSHPQGGAARWPAARGTASDLWLAPVSCPRGVPL